jgi:hypothetical protein
VVGEDELAEIARAGYAEATSTDRKDREAAVSLFLSDTVPFDFLQAQLVSRVSNFDRRWFRSSAPGPKTGPSEHSGLTVPSLAFSIQLCAEVGDGLKG